MKSFVTQAKLYSIFKLNDRQITIHIKYNEVNIMNRD